MSESRRSVITVGGASAERVLVVEPARYRPGGKHTVPPQRVLAGGSAVNHACRLLASGIDVDPIVPLCRDAIGDVVMRTMLDASARGGARLESEDLFVDVDGLASPFTTITSVGAERTIYTEFADELFAPFEAHLERRLGRLSRENAGALILGHLHADRATPPGRSGALTRRVVEAARGLGIPLFVNLGASQYRHGVGRFDDLLPHVACFQLDIDEMRTFVASAAGGRPSLRDILDWFRDRCSVLVTLERMGAVGQLVGSSQIVLTWPYEIEAVDTTGAGDAFAAGVVSAMLDGALSRDDDLARAMDRGGLFAAHACLTPGGADQSPTTDDLVAFHGKNSRVLDTEVTTIEQAGRILRLLDQAFSA